MDRWRLAIILSLIAVLALAVLGVVAASIVPFDVSEPATLTRFSDGVQLLRPGRTPLTLNPQRTSRAVLQPGQTVRVPSGGQITLRFDLNGGQAAVDGPATVRLVESRRRATAPGHVFNSDRFERHYALTIEQTGGTVRYAFADTRPQLAAGTITIRHPGGSYMPSTPCWEIAIQPNGETVAGPIDCPA